MKKNIDWNDKDAVRAYHREYAKKRYVPKKRKENKVDWTDKDAVRAYYRERYAQNPERKKQMKEWRENNKDKIKGYNKKAYKYIPKIKEKEHGTTPPTDNLFEVWKEIEGTDGYYMISNEGRVWSWRSGKMLKHTVNGMGYVYVGINGKATSLHRLLAKAFIPNPNGYDEIDHIDTNPLNNDLSNLRWVENHKENMNNPITLEKFKTSNRTKVNEKQITALRERTMVKVDMFSIGGEYVQTFNSMTEAASYMGKDRTCISACCRGKVKTCGGFLFKYHETA